MVQRADAATESSTITQPRLLALLCYLALARPRGLHARDTLIDLVWPDSDKTRGRRAIRNALYALRQALGANAIISVGENLVGLDPAVVSCDAIELERHGTDAFDASSPPEPFHGLHVDGAQPFDLWLSGERERLRGLLAERRHRHVVPRSASVTTTLRRPHTLDAAAMYARGHYLFLRTAHGGPAEDLLRSRDYFERARALDPTFAPAVAGLANFYAVASRRGVLAPFREVFGEGIRLAREALAMDETLAIPHVHFAVQALYLDDDWELAEREFATAVAKDPEYAEGHRFYGVWLGMAWRHDEALREMELAARLEPDIPLIVSSLAASRLAVGDRAGAESALRHTLALDPRHAPARARLVQLLEEEGRIAEALAERQRVPVMRDSDLLATAYATDGVEGYHRQLRESWRDEVGLIEARLVERHPESVQDIFAPPIVRLVTLLARLGDATGVRSWQLQGVAARPALARWFASIPELRRA
ncbi:MAG TPA: tetratricopeptide repeat protein [Gemmatimonadaceae bacterium]|nr:tetratricopeptide repeat protein [Gemmatimonadaceae bacterium]